jgi:hypothetical protein
MLHKWAPRTHQPYHSKLQVYPNFKRGLGVSVLPLTPLIRPLNGLCSTPLLWAQELVQLVPCLLEAEFHNVSRLGSLGLHSACHFQCHQSLLCSGPAYNTHIPSISLN